jgi:hypothetical protein
VQNDIGTIALKNGHRYVRSSYINGPIQRWWPMPRSERPPSKSKRRRVVIDAIKNKLAPLGIHFRRSHGVSPHPTKVMMNAATQ